jgi:hypothetical protein
MQRCEFEREVKQEPFKSHFINLKPRPDRGFSFGNLRNRANAIPSGCAP